MKRTITLIVCLVCMIASSHVNAQITVKPKAALDYYTNGYALKVDESVNRLGHFRARMGIDFNWKKFTIYADNHVFMNWSNLNKINFTPTLNNFFIGAEFKVNKIKIRYEHLCTHPIKSDDIQALKIYGGYDMFSISYGY